MFGIVQTLHEWVLSAVMDLVSIVVLVCFPSLAVHQRELDPVHSEEHASNVLVEVRAPLSNEDLVAHQAHKLHRNGFLATEQEEEMVGEAHGGSVSFLDGAALSPMRARA